MRRISWGVIGLLLVVTVAACGRLRRDPPPDRHAVDPEFVVE